MIRKGIANTAGSAGPASTGAAGARAWPSCGDAGFTLLELVVSITMVSLLATTILVSWRVASSAWQRANVRVREQGKVTATHQLLEEQMASMVPYGVRSTQGLPEMFFQGEPQAARFISRYSMAGRSRSGLYLIEYQVRRQADGTWQLLMNEFPVMASEQLGGLVVGAEAVPEGRVIRFLPVERGPHTRVLLEGLRECRLEYYRPARFAEPGGWTDQWVDLNQELPRGMAIRASAGSESGGLRPVSIVAAIRDVARRRPGG